MNTCTQSMNRWVNEWMIMNIEMLPGHDDHDGFYWVEKASVWCPDNILIQKSYEWINGEHEWI